jgi:hypothetical protein
MQSALANWTANMLSEQLGAKVEIGSVSLGFLNRVVVNDLTFYEPSGQKMASIARASASIDLLELLSNRVNIGTAQLFGTKATLYKETPDSPPNFQFIIDAFSKKEKEEPTPLNLHIGSLIMRHTDVTYDVKSLAQQKRKLDPNHLNLRDVGMNVVLRCLTDDSLNVNVRRLQGKELNSGLTIHDTSLKLVGNKQHATLSDMNLTMPHSQIVLDSLLVTYGQWEINKSFDFRTTSINGYITPGDLAPLYDKLSPLNQTMNFSITAEGNEEAIRVKECNISSENNDMTFRATAAVYSPLDKQKRNIHADIHTLRINSDEILAWADALAPDHHKESLFSALQEVAYEGTVDYNAAGELVSQGNLSTGIGHATYDLTYDKEHFLMGTLSGDSINIGKLQDDERFGTTSFDLDLAINLENTQPFPVGKATGTIYNIHYNGYNYQNINLDARSTSAQISGTASIDDENVKANADFAYTDHPTKDIDLNVLLEDFRPNNLNLTAEHIGESLSFNGAVQMQGIDFKHLYGNAVLEDIHLTTPSDEYHLDGIMLQAEQLQNGESKYVVKSDVVSGTIQGETTLADIAQSFIQQISHHLPIIFKPQSDDHASSTAHFTYDLTMADAPILHHFIDADYSIGTPIRIFGNLNAAEDKMSFQLDAPNVIYEEKPYTDIAVACNSTYDNMNVHAIASTFRESDDDEIPSTSTKFDVMADVHNNRIVSDLYVNTNGSNNIMLQLLPIVQLSDSMGSMKTDIALRKSTAVVNDTAWTVSPATISFYKKNIECHNVRFANNNTNSFLAIDGKASDSPTDSLVATLNNLEIQYIMSLVNWNVVRFAGKASGRAVVNNVLGDGVPDVKTNLYVENLSIQEGPLGDANITAHWDKDVDGIIVDGRMVDLYQVPDGLTGRKQNVTGITTVNGWISPAKNDMRLDVNTHNTNASFIHGFLGGVFKEVSGYVTGPVSIIGPFNNVNILADATPTMNLRLRATNVPYHIEGDTIHIRPYLFDFPNISIYDRFGHRSVLNGQVTHRNMKNFAYHFQTDLHELLAYDEKEFNSDKFLATVFADGDLTIDGSDGHPLHVNANVTPTRGSVFAYDAATPDAITGSSFIEFRDRDSVMTLNPQALQPNLEERPVVKDSLTIVKEAKKNYASDIFINFDINLTPACEVKLRMDNIEDGYMRTFGNAHIKASWYNKGSFQMFGNYNISSGSYRLYLQDIIFRDLALQPGSLVEFNGNPFDANIHLICHHTINSVPLSDLTSTTAFSQNNKVKVICILDITGKLGNMDFKFNMDLPNVNEETRQLVRSMINSEEEMNTQMIYLLGLGRFYPNEYARANGNGNSGQAMNSLLSSTLSGQINQMLSNMIGRDSNWNFGSSLTTGEKGWDDLDVEGILEGRLLDERLLINGAFGYRDNAMTNRSSFIGDFEVKWRMDQKGNLYVKAYNQTNDRYFTKATLNTQGIGLSWRRDFESMRRRMRQKEQKAKKKE